MNEITKEQIMWHKYHEFLYGYETNERTSFLKSMADDYPIIYGEDVPMGIYLKSYGIKNEKNTYELDCDKKTLLKIMAREYLKNSIVYELISKIAGNRLIMESIEKELIEFITATYYNPSQDKISVNKYLTDLKILLDIYKDNYKSIITNGSNCPNFLNRPDVFFEIERFGGELKKILKNKGQFNIIIDYKESVSLESIKAIMSIVNSRCAGTICMKIATSPESWPIYTDLNGVISENPHDYTSVELDDANKNMLEKRMKGFNLD